MKTFLIFLILLTASAQASVMAVAVLFTPDEDAQEWANHVNKETFLKYPQGFRFDDSHLSHVSILQMFVEVSCLDDKWDDLEKEIKAAKLLKEKISVKGLKAEALPSPSPLSFANLNLASNGKIIALQNRLIDVLRPCKSDVESPKAFSGILPAGDFMIGYVKNYLSQKTGDLYQPHYTVGVAKTEDLEKILSVQTPPKELTIKRIGVFRMGAFGTARERLFSFD